MTITDISLLSSMVFLVVGLFVFLLFVLPKQLRELLRPKDGLTGLRWRILLLAVCCSTAVIPPLIYRILRLLDYSPELLRNVSTVSSSLSFLFASVLFALIQTYRRKQ